MKKWLRKIFTIFYSEILQILKLRQPLDALREKQDALNMLDAQYNAPLDANEAKVDLIALALIKKFDLQK